MTIPEYEAYSLSTEPSQPVPSEVESVLKQMKHWQRRQRLKSMLPFIIYSGGVLAAGIFTPEIMSAISTVASYIPNDAIREALSLDRVMVDTVYRIGDITIYTDPQTVFRTLGIAATAPLSAFGAIAGLVTTRPAEGNRPRRLGRRRR